MPPGTPVRSAGEPVASPGCRAARRPGHLYAGLREGGVYRWTSAGRWVAINAGLPFATTQEYGLRFWGAIALDPVADILYAATAQGIFRLDPPDQ